MSDAPFYARRRKELANKIATIVLEHGLDELGLHNLAARLSTSSRMLVYYFGTKEALILESIAEISRRRGRRTICSKLHAKPPAWNK